MTDDTTAGRYVAPHPEPEEGEEFVMKGPTDPSRVLWIEGYGFDDETFTEVASEIGRMFQDDKSHVIVDEPENMTPKEAFEKGMRMRLENQLARSDDD